MNHPQQLAIINQSGVQKVYALQLIFLNVLFLKMITLAKKKIAIGMELFVFLTHVPNILMIQQSVFMYTVMIFQQSQFAHM